VITLEKERWNLPENERISFLLQKDGISSGQLSTFNTPS